MRACCQLCDLFIRIAGALCPSGEQIIQVDIGIVIRQGAVDSSVQRALTAEDIDIGIGNGFCAFGNRCQAENTACSGLAVDQDEIFIGTDQHIRIINGADHNTIGICSIKRLGDCIRLIAAEIKNGFLICQIRICADKL